MVQEIREAPISLAGEGRRYNGDKPARAAMVTGRFGCIPTGSTWAIEL